MIYSYLGQDIDPVEYAQRAREREAQRLLHTPKLDKTTGEMVTPYELGFRAVGGQLVAPEGVQVNGQSNTGSIVKGALTLLAAGAATFFLLK